KILELFINLNLFYFILFYFFLKKKRPFFKEDTILFGSVKLFGTGVILGVAFIHMLSPASELLTSKYTYSLFNEKYTSFAGAFAIIGILITHFVQVYASHFLEGSHKHDHIHVHSSSECGSSSSKSLKHEKSDIIKLEEGDISTEKQLVCYLLEIGISLHSVLIGIAFGLEKHGLIVLMIALMFHQFFEGVSLSSVFIEAHFKHIRSVIFMIVLYSFTLPIGGIIGLVLRSVIEETSKGYVTLQGIIDSVAAGILIYDVLVNILSRHCTSCNWKNFSLMGKNVQLFSFYIGLFVIAIIGIWA
ncbi:hypothetical protein PIROE2DRAFT_44839, partial [Piromyces sp. E2]